MKIKGLFLILVAIFLSHGFAMADTPSIYVKISKTNRQLIVDTKIFWNVESPHYLPSGYFGGSDTTVVRHFKINNHNVDLTFYFPEQIGGRSLNETTTVFLTVHLDGQEVFTTKHFGQHSGDRLDYEDRELLCRPNSIQLTFLEHHDPFIAISGDFNYTDDQNTDHDFSISHILKGDKIITDASIATAVFKQLN